MELKQVINKKNLVTGARFSWRMVTQFVVPFFFKKTKKTSALLALAVVAAWLMTMYQGFAAFDGSPYDLIRLGATYGPKVTSGGCWTLFSSAFINFSFLSMVISAFALLQAGRAVGVLDEFQFAMAFVTTAFASAAVSVFAYPLSVSAGTASAVIGLYGVLIGFCAVRRRGDLLIKDWKSGLAVGLLIMQMFLPQAVVGPRNLLGVATGFGLGLLLGAARGFRKQFEFSFEALASVVLIATTVAAITAPREPDVLTAVAVMSVEARLIQLNLEKLSTLPPPKNSAQMLERRKQVEVLIIEKLVDLQARMDEMKERALRRD